MATKNTFTSGYAVSGGAILDLAADDPTPAAITMATGARVIVSGSGVNLEKSTFAKGTVTIDRSASGRKTSGAKACGSGAAAR